MHKSGRGDKELRAREQVAQAPPHHCQAAGVTAGNISRTQVMRHLTNNHLLTLDCPRQLLQLPFNLLAGAVKQ